MSKLLILFFLMAVVDKSIACKAFKKSLYLRDYGWEMGFNSMRDECLMNYKHGAFD